MQLPADRRAELYAKGLKQIAASGENDFRRFLLVECLEAYAELAWIPTGKKTANKTAGSPAYFSL